MSVPYPKRLKVLIHEYQIYRRSKDFHKILELIDHLIIRIIRQIYKYPKYDYLKYYESDELYHTALIAMNKAILRIKPDDSFTIKRLSSYLNGYISKEYQTEFSKYPKHITIDDEQTLNLQSNEYAQEKIYISQLIDCIQQYYPAFTDGGVIATRKHLVEDKTFGAIAKEMNVERSQVKSWIFRGKRTIKEMILKDRVTVLLLSKK